EHAPPSSSFPVGDRVMSKLKSYQEQIQQSIDKGIGIVESQYKSLMARPFGLAEKVEVQTKNISVSELRAKHDQAVDNLSESLRNFNKKLNTYVSDVLVKIEGGAEKAVAFSAPPSIFTSTSL